MGEIERIERRLKLHDMRILLAVAESGSMGKAAERLGTSQPAISRAISDLEHALGVRLLDRTRQGIEATPYGRALIKRGLAVFDELRQGVKDIEFLTDPTAGELRIGCSESMAAGPVWAVIDQLTRRHPRIEIQIVNGSTPTFERDLMARNVELAITWATEPLSERELVAEILFEDRVVVAAGLQNPWTARRKVKLVELVNQPWTLPPHHSFVTTIATAAFRASGLDPPRATVIAQSLYVRNRLLATGRFFTVIGNFALTPPGRHPSLKAVAVDLPNAYGVISLVTLRNRTLSPLAELFIDSFRAAIRPLGRRR